MEDSLELKERREKLLKSIGESLILTDFSKEAFQAKRYELDSTIKKKTDEFERLHGHKPKEEQAKISIEQTFFLLFERFKETYLIGLKVSTSLIDVAKYYDLFDRELKLLISLSGFKSIKTKLDTVREIKGNFLMSLANAEQLIGLERNGVYKNPEPSKFVVTKKGIDGLIQRVEELGKNMREPLIVARANKRVYEDIITWLNREEEMILIELRNGKSLDYRPLNEKEDSDTSATVEESKKERKLSMREIALIYWYDRDNLSFSKSTAQQIAELYRHTSKSSGQSLYQDHFLSISNDEKQRTHNDNSVKYLNNIIPKLTTDRGKKEANEDLKKANDLQEKKNKKIL